MLFLNTPSHKKPKQRQPRKQVAGPKKPMFVEHQKAVAENPDIGNVLLCLTLKTNCVDVNKRKDNCEVIEIICQTVDIEKRYIMNNLFHSYVSPISAIDNEAIEKYMIRPYKLDNAESFPTVFKSFEKWLTENRISQKKCWGIVEDLEAFNIVCQFQFHKSSIPIHWAFKNCTDIRDEFIDFYKVFEPKEQLDVFRMCEMMYMKSEGKMDDGHDEVFNLAMIVAQMIRDGAVLNKDKNIS